jgi:hypothetical protein
MFGIYLSVILSEAKDLAWWATRSFASLRMTQVSQDDIGKSIRLSSPDMQMEQAFSGWSKPHPYIYMDMAYGEVPTICS